MGPLAMKNRSRRLDLFAGNAGNYIIAMALLRFTPEVTYADDFCVLMDVTASLSLFRGPRAICRQIMKCVRMLGFTATMGAAPTAMGAWLLSRVPFSKKYRQVRRVVQTGTMERLLERLPVLLLPSAHDHFEWLQGIDCDTIGQLILTNNFTSDSVTLAQKESSSHNAGGGSFLRQSSISCFLVLLVMAKIPYI